jgi:predicted DNA-binding transcriptional regulator AlpA
MSNPGPRRIKLAAHARALADGIQAGQAVPTGRLFGLPELPDGDYWLDMAGATALTGVPPKTITGWLARGGPARNPFPVPDRLLYRVYWRRKEIESWQARKTGVDSQPRARLNGE